MKAHNPRLGHLTALVLLAAATSTAAKDQPLFVARPLLAACEYTKHIEGPAVDATGNLFVVNLQRDGTIGKLAAGATESELFASLPTGSTGNGIRFDRDGRMYVADYKSHTIWVFEHGSAEPQAYAEEHFNQPNDLAITPDGVLYASDPHVGQPKSGRIWRITRGPDGKGRAIVLSSPRTMGTTNGLDLSPDGATLYVSESNTQEIWAHQITGNKLTDPHRVKKFKYLTGGDLDGLRTDSAGKIYVARQAEGKVVVLSPDGQVLHEVSLKGKNPTNLTFGGPDGKTVFVTEAEAKTGCIECFESDQPGREASPVASALACPAS